MTQNRTQESKTKHGNPGTSVQDFINQDPVELHGNGGWDHGAVITSSGRSSVTIISPLWAPRLQNEDDNWDSMVLLGEFNKMTQGSVY